MSARPMKLEIYRFDTPVHVGIDEHGVEFKQWPALYVEHGWRWRIKASNGRILADSGEAYGRLRDCAHGAGLVTGMDLLTVKPGFIGNEIIGDRWLFKIEVQP